MEKCDFACKECGESFSSERSMHAHIKKHGLILAENYTKFYTRSNLLTGDPLPFKNKDQYFNEDFSTRRQLLKWCESTESKLVEPYILKLLKRRIKGKSLKVGPSHLELKLSSLPTIDIYKKHFGSYTEACNKAGAPPMFSKAAPKEFYDDVREDIKIFIAYAEV